MDLHSKLEEALAHGLSYAEILVIVANAHSSLQADRLTAKDLGNPDPYPHLAASEND